MNRLLTSTLLVLALAGNASAQKQKSQKPVKTVKSATPKPAPLARTGAVSDLAADEQKVRDMISFLGFMLNTLGNSNTPARDKDVVVSESYSKIFRDAKVQVEDDLDQDRGVVTNEDIVAYLKDIVFFFKDVKFEFTVEKVERGVNADNQTFYKVSINRNLSGTTSDGQAVNNAVPRFIEVNFNPADQDLKIVSMYTHEFNEKEALTNWWKQMSLEWQTIFRKSASLSDSVSVNDIRKITSIEKLDLSGNHYLQTFEPLSAFKNLRILNLSYTTVEDLSPIRNLTELTELNLSHTGVHDLSPLRYSVKLIKLDISNTLIADVAVLQRMPKLQFLDLGATGIKDINPIAGLTGLVSLNLRATPLSEITSVENMSQLTELNISRTQVQDLSPAKGLKNLKILTCDSTRIRDISPLAGLDNLIVLQVNATGISALQPLQPLAHLEKIYCDETPVNKNMAEAFMHDHPGTLVMYDSHDLKAWWDPLSAEWKDVIGKAAKISRDPLKEELARVGNVDSINVGGRNIRDLEPLRKLQKLKVIRLNHTAIQDLSALRE
ncbi:MAG TPA: leucine-rich repeat domain-containing protein, partial [Cyclobacteriaceae bacterium]|nr:leucine-rich repeat domain-containing protein [Cyclobacteriaceae bacterium]